MALLASNTESIANKWLPYYWKPFVLGRSGDGVGSTDSGTYITDMVAGGGPIGNGVCFSSHNCGYYYIVEFESTATDAFSVKKYDLDDNLIDDIEATTGEYWDATVDDTLISIDIGVAIYFNSLTSASDGDKFKITLPSTDTMDRRKIYHGGYSTFMKVPETEAISYHSDIIPCNLKGRNITVSLNPPLALISNAYKPLSVAHSEESSNANYAISCLLEWNVNPKGGHSGVAVADYGWHADETWQLGTVAHYDIDPKADFPVSAHLPSSDLTSGGADPMLTGTTQNLNTQVAGRAGHAKIRLEYEAGDGSPSILAHNQFWPLILNIS